MMKQLQKNLCIKTTCNGRTSSHLTSDTNLADWDKGQNTKAALNCQAVSSRSRVVSLKFLH